MVPIRTNGYNHFVIFRGIAGNRVLLAEQTCGNRTMLKYDFEKKTWIDYPKIGHVGFVVAKADGVLVGTKSPCTPGRRFVLFR